jgi:hypothetical protein
MKLFIITFALLSLNPIFAQCQPGSRTRVLGNDYERVIFNGQGGTRELPAGTELTVLRIVKRPGMPGAEYEVQLEPQIAAREIHDNNGQIVACGLDYGRAEMGRIEYTFTRILDCQ